MTEIQLDQAEKCGGFKPYTLSIHKLSVFYTKNQFPDSYIDTYL